MTGKSKLLKELTTTGLLVLCLYIFNALNVNAKGRVSKTPAAQAEVSAAGNLQLMGNRFFTFSTIVRVNQIEVSRDRNEGFDESGIHTPEGARIFRETIEKWIGCLRIRTGT